MVNPIHSRCFNVILPYEICNLSIKGIAQITLNKMALNTAAASAFAKATKSTIKENFIWIFYRVFKPSLNSFRELQKAGILSEANKILICQCQNPNKLASVLNHLQHAGILTQENFLAVGQHQNLEILSAALRFLHLARILEQNNFEAIIHVHNPNLGSALYDLYYAGILTQDNFIVVIQHRDLWSLASAMRILRLARILTQDHFNALLLRPVLVSRETTQQFWNRMPSYLLIPPVWRRLLALSEQPDSEQLISALADRLLGIAPQEYISINPRKGTHLAIITSQFQP